MSYLEYFCFAFVAINTIMCVRALLNCFTLTKCLRHLFAVIYTVGPKQG